MSEQSLISHAPDLLAAIEQGALIRDIAEKYNVSRAAVSNALRRANPERYRLARQIGIESRLEDALSDQMQAQDVVSIARAREVFKSQAWLAERTLPEFYGSKQTVTHQGSADKPLFVVHRAGARQGRTIDAETDSPPVDFPDAG